MLDRQFLKRIGKNFNLKPQQTSPLTWFNVV